MLITYRMATKQRSHEGAIKLGCILWPLKGSAKCKKMRMILVQQHGRNKVVYLM